MPRRLINRPTQCSFVPFYYFVKGARRPYLLRLYEGRVACRKDSHYMNTNEDDAQESQPSDSQNENQYEKKAGLNEPAGDEPAREASEDKQVHWKSGVLQVEFEEGVNPQFVLSQGGTGLMMEGEGNVERFNKAIEQLSPLLTVEPTFPTAHAKPDEFNSAEAEQEEELGPNLKNFYTLYFPPEANVSDILYALRQLPGLVRAASVIPKTRPASASPLGESLVGMTDRIVTLSRDGLENQWYIFRCGINRAWRMATGQGVVVADIDYGYFTDHVELAGRLNLARRHNSYDGSDNISQGADTRHGTAVMGLIGAAINSEGIAGIAHNAELWPIQANIGLALGNSRRMGSYYYQREEKGDSYRDPDRLGS
jgi:subtilisin family serine protease